jgi:hypothetical protein
MVWVRVSRMSFLSLLSLLACLFPPTILRAQPPQCSAEVCTSDSVDCNSECGVGNTVYTCMEYIVAANDGICAYSS